MENKIKLNNYYFKVFPSLFVVPVFFFDQQWYKNKDEAEKFKSNFDYESLHDFKSLNKYFLEDKDSSFVCNKNKEKYVSFYIKHFFIFKENLNNFLEDFDKINQDKICIGDIMPIYLQEDYDKQINDAYLKLKSDALSLAENNHPNSEISIISYTATVSNYYNFDQNLQDIIRFNKNINVIPKNNKKTINCDCLKSCFMNNSINIKFKIKIKDKK